MILPHIASENKPDKVTTTEHRNVQIQRDGSSFNPYFKAFITFK
jgi:hypothetical protein